MQQDYTISGRRNAMLGDGILRVYSDAFSSKSSHTEFYTNNYKQSRSIGFSLFTFTGKAPRKGNRAPLNQIKYSEERDEEKEMSGGHFASERGEEPRSGIQYCSSPSFTNFGARYMDHELMTMWLSIDPMAPIWPTFPHPKIFFAVLKNIRIFAFRKE